MDSIQKYGFPPDGDGNVLTFEPQHVISNNVAFWHVYTQTHLCSPHLSLETPNGAQSVA